MTLNEFKASEELQASFNLGKYRLLSNSADPH